MSITGTKMTSTSESNITIAVENDKSHLVKPNFIYNRFDLWTGLRDFCTETLHVTYKDYDCYVQVLYRSDSADLGLWLSDIPAEAVEFVARYIFREHSNVSRVTYDFCMNKPAFGGKCNHFRIELPDSIEELNGRISSKFRYNLKRERKMLEKAAGTLSFEEYEAHDFPDDLMTEYFRMKAITHGKDYHMTGSEYIDAYHISHAYVIRRSGSREIVSIVLSCEQCPAAYIENLTYSTEYAKYSPGKMAYHYFLESLIRKRKTELFLRDGNHEYKRHYGSIEETAYSGVIYRKAWRSIIHRAVSIIMDSAKKLLPDKAAKVIRKLL